MCKPHKHAALIKLWADGAKIQWFHEADEEWKDCTPTPNWLGNTNYRVKPEPVVVEYKRYIYKFNSDTPKVYIEYKNECAYPENYKHFVKWIDTEWQTIELENE
jgi:hypothetical protein